jgi:hypothetical protein
VVPALVELVEEQHGERGHERQQVVHQPVDGQGRQELVGRQPRLQEEDHQRFEHADAARHMAHERDQLRGEERAKEEREVRSCDWQQHVEHCPGERPVERGQDEL